MALEDAKQHCEELAGCVGFTVHSNAEQSTFAEVYFENGLQTVYAPGWTAFEKPSGPVPSPMPLPTPTPSPSPLCPDDADLVVTSDGHKECLWSSGAHGVDIPLSASQYCDYIADGYFGYYWSSSEDHECAQSARKSENGETRFCVWTDGERGVTFPHSSLSDCARLSEGRIGVILGATQSDFLI